MGVVSYKELPQKNVYEIGKTRSLTREFVCVLDDNTLENNPTEAPAIATALGIDLGSAHPIYSGYRVRKITMSEGHEGSPYHTHMLYEYGIITLEELKPPTQRLSVWEFDGQPSEVPALFYYDGATQRPLTNSAYDFFPGLMTFESIVLARVTKNFASFPSTWFGAMNHVNSNLYLGCPQDSIRVEKVTVKQEQEDGSWGPTAYWQATAELHYRQSGHSLLLPDIGWNAFVNGQKQRAMVFDFQNGEWVPSANPVGLNGNGGLAIGNPPAILTRRLNPRADFLSLFGAPPNSPLPI